MKSLVLNTIGVLVVSAFLIGAARWVVYARSQTAKKACLDNMEAIEAFRLLSECQYNMGLVDYAKRRWIEEYGKGTNTPAPALQDLRRYIGSRVPACPCGGVYLVGGLDQTARCSLKPEDHKRAIAR
jgi:hypothetical protein